MKLEICEPKDEKKKEEPTKLALKQKGCDIFVVVVDENGNKIDRGNLLGFAENGVIKLCSSVSSKLGFQLDENGCIKTEKI